MFQDIPLIVFAGILGWLLVHMFPRREKTLTSADRRISPVRSFYAVSVLPGSDCCQSAEALKRKRFLSNEAPYLPVADCTAEKCHCVYRHHTDRRTGNANRRARSTEKDALLRRVNKDRRLIKGHWEIETRRLFIK